MSLTETVIEGTVQPDGTLILDEPTKLPAGRVTVVVRQKTEIELPSDDPFWQRMKAMWDAQDARGHVPRSVAEVEADRRQVREESEERQSRIEALQEECWQAREAAKR